MYQKSYGSTYGPLMHANSIQNEKLDDWSVFGDRFWGIRMGFVGLLVRLSTSRDQHVCIKGQADDRSA